MNKTGRVKSSAELFIKQEKEEHISALVLKWMKSSKQVEAQCFFYLINNQSPCCWNSCSSEKCRQPRNVLAPNRNDNQVSVYALKHQKPKLTSEWSHVQLPSAKSCQPTINLTITLQPGIYLEAGFTMDKFITHRKTNNH